MTMGVVRGDVRWERFGQGRSVDDEAGSWFALPGVIDETDLLYLATLAALAIGGPDRDGAESAVVGPASILPYI